MCVCVCVCADGAPLNITISPAVVGHRLTAFNGSNVSIPFNLSGASPDQVIWTYTTADNTTVNISSPQYTLTDCSLILHLEHVSLADAGSYTASVFVRGSSGSASVELLVQGTER